jgi:hypothetical protein
MNLSRFSLGKMGDALIKAAEAKAHFDDREKLKTSDQQKIETLKNILTEEYKFLSKNKNKHQQYAIRFDVVEKHVEYIKKLQSKKILENSDREIIEKLLNKYSK